MQERRFDDSLKMVEITMRIPNRRSPTAQAARSPLPGLLALRLLPVHVEAQGLTHPLVPSARWIDRGDEPRLTPIIPAGPSLLHRSDLGLSTVGGSAIAVGNAAGRERPEPCVGYQGGGFLGEGVSRSGSHSFVDMPMDAESAAPVARELKTGTHDRSRRATASAPGTTSAAQTTPTRDVSGDSREVAGVDPGRVRIANQQPRDMP